MFFILLAALSEDERGFIEKLYDDYNGKVLAIARMFLHNEQDTMEAVNDIFIKIMNHADKFMQCDCDKIGSLIVIYSRGVLFDLYRRRKKTGKIFTSNIFLDDNEEEYEIDIADSDVDLDNILINKETVKLLENTLHTLKQQDKDIIKLMYYYNYRQREIAEILSMTESNVSTRLARAKIKLFVLLKGELYDRL
jgi:RNA polymerase sigma-70 factor, ECF subfamily